MAEQAKARTGCGAGFCVLVGQGKRRRCRRFWSWKEEACGTGGDGFSRALPFGRLLRPFRFFPLFCLLVSACAAVRGTPAQGARCIRRKKELPEEEFLHGQEGIPLFFKNGRQPP